MKETAQQCARYLYWVASFSRCLLRIDKFCASASLVRGITRDKKYIVLYIQLFLTLLLPMIVIKLRPHCASFPLHFLHCIYVSVSVPFLVSFFFNVHQLITDSISIKMYCVYAFARRCVCFCFYFITLFTQVNVIQRLKNNSSWASRDHQCGKKGGGDNDSIPIMDAVVERLDVCVGVR